MRVSRRMQWQLAALAVFGAGLAYAHSVSESAKPLTVTRAVDGDTLKLSDGRTIRLLGVDTPETHDPRKPVQCYGPEAAKFTEAMTLGATVKIRREPSSGETTDRYGRTLAYVSVVGVDLGVLLLRDGYARVYAYHNRHFGKRAGYELLERRAQAAKVGRWGHCGV